MPGFRLLLLVFLQFFCLGCLFAQAQDDPFNFSSPFASDGTNDPRISTEERNHLVFGHLWHTYSLSRAQLDTRLPKSSVESQSDLDRAIKSSRYAILLESMAELRAFTSQNKGYTTTIQDAQIAVFDEVLQSLNLHYQSRGVLAMGDYCNKGNLDQISQALEPVLRMSYVGFTGSDPFQKLATSAQPGILGIAVCDLSTGVIIGANLDHKFPLQSVFKLFLAAALLDKVDVGELSLDQSVVIKPGDVRDGSGPVADTKGGTFSVRDLIRAALINSDNTAADNLLPLIGGPIGVTNWLHQHQIEDIEVDRDERTLAREIDGIPASFHPGENADPLRSKISEDVQKAAFQTALTEDRDTATPQGAVDFLVALQRGKLLTPQSTQLLIKWMRECITGPDRLKAGFPSKTVFGHKTGTGPIRHGVALATNDIGLATLPDGRTLAIAVFLMASSATEEKREALIAACARAAATTSK